MVDCSKYRIGKHFTLHLFDSFDSDKKCEDYKDSACKAFVPTRKYLLLPPPEQLLEEYFAPDAEGLVSGEKVN